MNDDQIGGLLLLVALVLVLLGHGIFALILAVAGVVMLAR